MRVEYLTRVPLFAAVSGGCKVALAEALKTEFLGRGEFIIIEGEQGAAMYFIIHQRWRSCVCVHDEAIYVRHLGVGVT